MKRLLFLLPLLFACKGGMKNDSKYVVSFGTSLTFEQIGPKDVNAESLMYIDFMDWAKQPLIDWIAKNEQSPNDDVIAELND